MKKYIISGIAVLAIAAVAAWNVNFNSQKNELSDVQLANVEALAQESGGLIDCGSLHFACCYTAWTDCSNILYSLCRGSVTIEIDPSC
jgi:hypothetical protein